MLARSQRDPSLTYICSCFVKHYSFGQSACPYIFTMHSSAFDQFHLWYIGERQPSSQKLISNRTTNVQVVKRRSLNVVLQNNQSKSQIDYLNCKQARQIIKLATSQERRQVKQWELSLSNLE